MNQEEKKQKHEQGNEMKKKKRIGWKPLKELPKSAGSKTAKYVKGSKILRKATTKVDLAEHENGLLTALPLVPLSLD